MRRQPREKVVALIQKRMREGNRVGVKVTVKFRKRLGRPAWSRVVEGRPRILTNRSVLIDEGSTKKMEVLVPLTEVIEAYFVSG